MQHKEQQLKHGPHDAATCLMNVVIIVFFFPGVFTSRVILISCVSSSLGLFWGVFFSQEIKLNENNAPLC